VGPELTAGQAAPDFTLLANDLTEVGLSDFAGKIVLIATVPSIDTSVCDTEARRFNEEAAALGDGVCVLVVSMDLPFAQQRWCGAAGIENVRTLSDHRDASFGESYGVLISELRLLARSIWVLDAAGTIRYIELVGELTDEPDYNAALAAVRSLIPQKVR
jgi:thiol peroxidase